MQQVLSFIGKVGSAKGKLVVLPPPPRSGMGVILALPCDFFENAGQSQTFSVDPVHEMDDDNSRNLGWGRTLRPSVARMLRVFSPGHM